MGIMLQERLVAIKQSADFAYSRISCSYKHIAYSHSKARLRVENIPFSKPWTNHLLFVIITQSFAMEVAAASHFEKHDDT